jgi:hypothetical protein
LQPQDIHERINEFRRTRAAAGSDEIRLLEVALFLEDVFGICLIDEEICEKNLGTHDSTEQFVLNKCEKK